MVTIDDTADVVIIIATLGPGRVGCYIYVYFYTVVLDELSYYHHCGVVSSRVF